MQFEYLKKSCGPLWQREPRKRTRLEAIAELKIGKKKKKKDKYGSSTPHQSYNICGLISNWQTLVKFSKVSGKMWQARERKNLLTCPALQETVMTHLQSSWCSQGDASHHRAAFWQGKEGPDFTPHLISIHTLKSQWHLLMSVRKKITVSNEH